MAKIEYPLERVLEIKKKRVATQEKVVLEKQRELEKEKEKLRLREEERDKVLQHKKDKLNQIREEMDHGTTTDKIIQMKVYLKVVEERLKVEEKKVHDQRGQVNIAEKNLEIAKEELRLKRQEVDKLHTHRIDWMKQKMKELAFLEEKEMDEVGQTLHTVHQRRGF